MVFRSEEEDIKVLPKYIAKHFMIGYLQYNGFEKGFICAPENNYYLKLFKHFIALAVLDYELIQLEAQQLEEKSIQYFEAYNKVNGIVEHSTLEVVSLGVEANIMVHDEDSRVLLDQELSLLDSGMQHFSNSQCVQMIGESYYPL